MRLRVHATSTDKYIKGTIIQPLKYINIYYVDASVAVLGLGVGAGLDGQEFSGVRRGVFRLPFRTVSSSLGLNVRGTKPSASATRTIHNGPGK